MVVAEAKTQTVRIARLGHRGDGIAEVPDGPLYVPLTLPGERVEILRDGSNRSRGRMVRLLEASPARTGPVCAHYGECGGCALQHMKPPAYLAWKRDQIRQTLAQRGLEAEVGETIPLKPGTRRRTVFTATRVNGRSVFGYHARHSHRIVEVTECPILVPEIASKLKDLAGLVGPIVPSRGEIRVAVTATLTGLDVALEGPTVRPPALVPLAAPLVKKLGVARLSIAGEPILQMTDPVITIGGAAVTMPPLAFLQAAADAEAAMARLVGEGVGNAKRIADLYAGVGTFALRLAKQARVLAVEGEGAALEALAQAAKRTPRLKAVETLKRDLARMPLSPEELKGYGAVVFDPPRAGAAAQCEQIARSRVPRIIAVSCNPATLARDLRILVDGGYRIDKVTPVDQFLFSPHIEAVALLTREK